MKIKKKQNQYKPIERNGLLALALNSEKIMPSNPPYGSGRTARRTMVRYSIDGTKLESCAGRYTFYWRDTRQIRTLYIV